MRKETDAQQREANREIRSIMASPTILLGRTLILVAKKKEGAGRIQTIQASEV